MNFNKKALEKLPTPKDKPAIYHDSKVVGLGLSVQANTGTKSFFWFRRVRGRLESCFCQILPNPEKRDSRQLRDQYAGITGSWQHPRSI